MSTQNRELLDRILSFEIDEPGVAFPFEARLAQENRWDVAFAARVVAEYKRFMFLMVAAGHPVTPSDHVDQAWHLHLAYTRSYWDRLCGRIVGRPLHHNPTRGGESEGLKFDTWYRRTLQTYERTFGHAAPADIWTPPAARFGIDPQAVRVNTVRNWIVPKSAVRRGAALGVLSLAGAGLLAGCGIVLARRGAGESLMYVLAGLLVLIVLIAILTKMGRDHRPGSGCGDGSAAGGCATSQGGSDGHDHSSAGDSAGGHSGCGGSSGCSSSGCSSGCGGGGCGGGGCGGGG